MRVKPEYLTIPPAMGWRLDVCPECGRLFILSYIFVEQRPGVNALRAVRAEPCSHKD